MKAMPGNLTCPLLWIKFVEHLGGDHRLARELWGKLWPTEASNLMYSLSRIEDTSYHPNAVQRFGEVATPVLLMALCVRLAPETGKPRRRDVVQFEELILQTTVSRDGGWLR